CSIEVWSLWALGFRASAQPPLYIKSLTAGRAVSCYRVSAGKNPPARRTDCYEGRQWRFQTGGKINSCSTDFLASYPAISGSTSGRPTPWFPSKIRASFCANRRLSPSNPAPTKRSEERRVGKDES